MPVNSCVYNVELWIQEFTGANQKTVKTLVVSKFNRKFAAKTIIMKSYGRKIIDYIFKRWAERPAICYEPERKVQADSDRSDIRVFETGLSTQRHGDYWQGKRTAEEEECHRLIEVANAHDLYIEKSDWNKFGNRRRIPTGESIVYLSKDGSTYTKLKSPFAKAPMKHILPEDIIYEHLIHNILFPDTRYHFIGISENSKSIRIVLQQKIFHVCSEFLPKK